ncbi:MAG: MFS transporter [Planctomycetota bacterium]|nr:MFS transporter [Planctomycetota bacterium]
MQTPSAGASPGTDDAPPSRWGVLRHRHFRTVWIASFGSYVGGWFEFVGVQWIVTEKTGEMVWSSYLGAAQLLPSLVLGILGGVVADRVNRKKLLLVTQAAMMVIAIAFALVVWLDPPQRVLLPALLGLSLAQGVVVAFNNPAWQVLTPRLVPRADLVKAITLQGISFNAARAVGPALAGVIMGLWSPMALFVVNAVSFIGVMVAVLTTPDAPVVNPESRWWRKLWADTKFSAEFVFKRRGPRAALLATTVFAAFGTPVLRFLSMFVSSVYHLEERTFGVLTGVMGAGAVAGGFAMKLVPPWYPRHHFIPLSVLMGGFWILLFSITSNPWIAGGLMFFVGWFWMWSFNSAMSALQMLVEDAVRGRALALVNVVALGAMPLGYFFASGVGEGVAAAVKRAAPDAWHDGLATQTGVGVCAAILFIAGIVMLTFRTPEVDGLSPGDPGYDRRPGLIRGLFARAHRPPSA